MYIIKSVAMSLETDHHILVTVVAVSIYKSLERSMIEVTTHFDPQQVYMLGPLRSTGPPDEEFTARVALETVVAAFPGALDGAVQTIQELIESSEPVSIDALRDLQSWLETGVMPGTDDDDDE